MGATGAAEPVALAHDYLLFLRGAERTFLEMARAYPEAPVYTVAYREEATEGRFADRRIVTSPLQRAKLSRSWFRAALPLYPWAVGRLRPAAHEFVVSSSFAFIHGLRVPAGTRHVCYCHSPFRQAWHERDAVLAGRGPVARRALGGVLERIRRWDLEASKRVHSYIANSRITQERIADFYGRESAVVHPPVNVERFSVAPDGDPGDGYFLVVGELVPHKRTAVALDAARRAGKRIVVAGDGPERRRLEAEFGGSAEFAGRVPDAELDRLYERCSAVVMPNVEEFGITGVEGQAAGRPVLALDAGGAQETVVAGETGVLVPPGDPDGFAEAMREVDFSGFSAARARENAERFSAARFRARLREAVARD